MLPALALSAALAGQPECLPCDAPEAVQVVLEESFREILSLPDCAGASNLGACRTIEGRLADALEAVESVVRERRIGEGRCLSCDPGVRLAPLVDGLVALGRLLSEKGYQDHAPSLRRMEDLAASFESLRCCLEEKNSEPARETTREQDARAVLLEKCGAGFVDNRRGLRQVVRAPGDREGCYQSRACRESSSSNGNFMPAGFWTYDGEYWYVWAERRTPRGEWTGCAG